jgi:hypothetical protein
MPFNPTIIVEVWDRENSTLLAELPRRWDVTGSDPLNVAGMGTVSVSTEDAIFARQPTLFAWGNWVKYYLTDGLGNGAYIGAMQIRRRKRKFIGDNEWSDMVMSVSGPMVLGILSDMIVKHEVQPPREDASESRSYFWGSEEGEWYDGSQWSASIVSEGRWDSHITNPRSGTVSKPKYKPEDWPVPAAEWIHVSGGGAWQFYRTWIEVPDGGAMIKLFATADEIMAVWFAGDRVITRDEYEFGYKSFSEYKTYAPEGIYQVGILMRSKNTPGGDGVDAFLFAAVTLNDSGDPDVVLRKSNNTAAWEAHVGLPPPGWKQAEILRSWMSEAQSRHGQDWDSAQLLSVNFSADQATDQGFGESRTWVIELSMSFRIGTTYLDGTAKLCEIGDFDLWVNPDTFQLNAAKRRGRDASDNFALEPGRNLVGWEVDEVDTVINDITAKYDGGWVDYEAAGSADTYGHREAGISLGSVADDETAEVIASAHVERRKHARRRAGHAAEVERDEDSQPTAALVASPGSVPFIHYGTGWSIKAPLHTGVQGKQRLLSLSFSEDNVTGEVSFDPEFGEED